MDGQSIQLPLMHQLDAIMVVGATGNPEVTEPEGLPADPLHSEHGSQKP